MTHHEHHEHPLALSADSIKGDRVVNFQGEDVGHIEEVMIDVHTGRVAYVVLSFGGLLGIGNKLFAVPWDSLVLDAENKRFRMDVHKDLLERAPGFDKDNWPQTPNAQWYSEVYSHYGATPYWGNTR